MALEALGDLVPRVHPEAWVHPAATVIGDVEVGAGSSVWPGAVLRGDSGPIRIGAGTSIQDGVVVHGVGPGTFVGDLCIVGHQAFLEEAVVEDRCLIGIGSRVLNGARVGEGAVVAAGAVLVQALQVPPGERAQGVPARVVPGPRDGGAGTAAAAAHYREKAERYRREWRPLS